MGHFVQYIMKPESTDQFIKDMSPLFLSDKKVTGSKSTLTERWEIDLRPWTKTEYNFGHILVNRLDGYFYLSTWLKESAYSAWSREKCTEGTLILIDIAEQIAKLSDYIILSDANCSYSTFKEYELQHSVYGLSLSDLRI